MKRYVTRPASAENWEARAVDYLTRTVHEFEPAPPRKTGLLDASGNPIFSVGDPRPLGFIHFGAKS